MRTFRLALAQVNPTVGDIAGNTDIVLQRIDEARAQLADLVALPELMLTGYPPEDLLLKPSFIRDNIAALERVVAASKGHRRRRRVREQRGQPGLQRRRGGPQRQAGRRLPQGLPAQLRRL